MSLSNADHLIELLACPKCHGKLKHVQTGAEGFACESCKLFFAVVDELPNMLLDDAKPWPLTAGRGVS